MHTAEPRELVRLQAARRVAKNARRKVAKNGLAIVGEPGAKTITKATELLAPRFKKVALAEPACPLGKYSQDYLERMKIYDQLSPKVLRVDNSRAVLAAVASGAAQAGVAFSSDASGHGSWRQLLVVPSSQASTIYEAAVLEPAANRKEARALCEFLTSRAAARCYRRCGLRPI